MKRIFIVFAVLFAFLLVVGCDNPVGVFASIEREGQSEEETGTEEPADTEETDTEETGTEETGTEETDTEETDTEETDTEETDTEETGTEETGTEEPTEEPVVEEPVLNEYGWDTNQSGYSAFRFVEDTNGLVYGNYYLETVDPGYSWPTPLIGAGFNWPYTFIPSHGGKVATVSMFFSEGAKRELDKVFIHLLDADGNSVFEITYKPKLNAAGDRDGVLELRVNGEKIGDDYIHNVAIEPNAEVGMTMSFGQNNMAISFGANGNAAVDFDLTGYESALETEIVNYAFGHRGEGNSGVILSPVSIW